MKKEIKTENKVEKEFDMQEHDRKMKKVLFIFNVTFIICMAILLIVQYFIGGFKMP
jgi:hypothetical protein